VQTFSSIAFQNSTVAHDCGVINANVCLSVFAMVQHMKNVVSVLCTEIGTERLIRSTCNFRDTAEGSIES
jgi:hypothetical protein